MPQTFSRPYKDFDSYGGHWYGDSSGYGASLDYDIISVNGDYSDCGDISEVSSSSGYGIGSGSSGYKDIIYYDSISLKGENSGFSGISEVAGRSDYGVGSGSVCLAARNSIIVKRICCPWMPVCKYITFDEFF